MFRPEEIFDALLTRAAGEQEAERLLGRWTENRAALYQKLCGHHFSLLFLEIPLAGKPGFDLHIIHNAEDIKRDAPFADSLYGGYGKFFSRYADIERGGDGLDVVYDLRESFDAAPMIYIKMQDDSLDFETLFRELGEAGAAARYRAKRKELPALWHTWYTGVHTGRKGKPLRLGSFLADDIKRRYAEDIELLVRDLQNIGFPAPLSWGMKEKLRELFAFSWPIDIQLDVLATAMDGLVRGQERDGTALHPQGGGIGDTLGISFCTGDIGRNALAADFAQGEMRNLMQLCESWGVADERWQHIPAATFAVSRLLRSKDGDKQRFILSGHLSFVKVRFRGTGALVHDAKAYLCLEAKTM